MNIQRLRGAALVCSVTMLLLAVPGEGKACCWLDHLFGRCSCGSYARTAYTPAYSPAPAWTPPCSTCASPCSTCASPCYSCASPCSSCASPCSTCASPCYSCAPQTCQYVPQTCYRTYYRSVPVTAYRPVTSCDPCSGCPVTSYYPTTAWAYQPCLVPYTTYRAVYSYSCAPLLGCGSCGSACGGCAAPCGSCGGGCDSGGCGTAVAPAAGCSCGVGATSGAPNPTYSTSGATATSGTSLGPATPTPALGPGTPSESGTGTTTPGKYPAVPPLTPGPSGPLSPIPDKTPLPDALRLKGGALEKPADPSAGAPNGSEPGPAPLWNAPSNHTAARPVYQAGYFQLIASPPKAAPVYQVKLDNSGWRPSHE